MKIRQIIQHFITDKSVLDTLLRLKMKIWLIKKEKQPEKS